MELLLDWNEGNEPPWSEGELRAKVNSTAAAANGDRGFMFADDWTEQLEAEAATEEQTSAAKAQATPAKGGGKSKGGKKGGNRKKAPPQLRAHQFVEANPNLIYLRGHYWRYDEQQTRYIEIGVGDKRPLDAPIARFLEAYPDDITTTYVKDIELNVRAQVEVVDAPVEFEFWLNARDDRDSYLPMRNGLFNVSEWLRGERDKNKLLTPHSADHFHTAVLPFDFDPEAEAPDWGDFIRDAMRGNDDLVALVQEAFGYTFVYDQNHERFFIFYGPGGTGKSVALRTLEAMVGGANVSHLKLDQLKDPYLIDLFGKRVNIATETKKNAEIDDSALKTAVSKESVAANRKYRPAVEFVPLAVFFYATNFKTRFNDTTTGMARRLRTIPFVNVVASPNPNFFEEMILPSMSGVFNWALAGLERVNVNNWTESNAELALRNEFLKASSSARLFLNENVVTNPKAATRTSTLYEAYKAWAKRNGYNPSHSGNFKDEVLRSFPEARYEVITGGKLRDKRVWVGIQLIEPEDAEWGDVSDEANITGEALADVLSRTTKKELVH